MKNPARLLFIVFAVLLLIPQSCIKRHILTDSDIEAHYKKKKHRPRFGHFPANDTTGIHFATSGADTLPLVVMIHGAPGAWYGYMEYIDDTLLQKHMQLVSVDRPGYGKSGRRAVTSIQEQARRLHPLIDSMRNGRPVLLVGRSYGAPIAARLAADYPQDVSELLLIAPAVAPELEKFWWFSKPVNSKAMRWIFPAAINRASDEKFTHREELRRLEPLWDSIKVPVTVVQGDQDAIADTANLTWLKRKLPSAQNRFIRLKGAGHMITEDRPEFMRELLTSMTDSLRAKRQVRRQ
jgi:pimeloyl-ACP methyl ester carboxylesterase